MSKLLPIIEYFIDNQLYWDFLVKWVISLLMVVKVVKDLIVYNLSDLQTKKNEFINHVSNSDIADHEKEVNDLHYEMSVDIMKLMLGPLLKHSACYFPTGKETLKEAEIAMLELYCKRAECFDGMKCLDVGCGWGSLAFYLAKKYPKSTITCFTNSKAQVYHIEKVCEDENITNVITVLGDLNNPPKDFINRFDRIIAVELLEHLKNYKLCFNTFYKWLDYDGKLFIQSFGYRLYPSHFEFDQNQRASNWLAKYFCKGATMVSLDIYLYFQDKLKLENCWLEKGTHYANSFKHWIKQIDSNKKELQDALSEYYGDKQEGFYWFSRWRFFLLVSSTPFRLFGGNFWGIGHYLFKKPSALKPSTSSLYSID